MRYQIAFDDLRWIMISVLILFLVGCGTDRTEEPADEIEWTQTQVDALNKEQKNLYDKAERARQDLAKTLFGRLTEVISSDGPAEAIEVCNVEAQGMTQKIGEKYNLKIGRTSFKLRNPENTPPSWAQKFNLVEKRVQDQVVLEKGNEHLAVMTPIRLAEKCTACHGQKTQINDAVKQKLTRLYPDDEATGFKQGDLRGWFWVEAPK